MKNILIAILLTLSTVSLQANETRILPILTGDYCPNPTMAVTTGYNIYDDIKDSGSSTYGLEIAFGCPIFEIKDLEINQVLGANHYKKDNFSITTVEMNPRIMFELDNRTKVGVGPGVSILFVDNNNNKDTILGFNIGATVNYQLNDGMFIGLDIRHQFTQKTNVFSNNINLNNNKTVIKIGKSF